MEQLKKDVFGQFVQVESLPVDASGPDALTQELTDFVDCVKTGRTPHVDGEQGLAAMLVADAVLKSVAQHQWDGHANGAVGPNPQIQTPRRKWKRPATPSGAPSRRRMRRSSPSPLRSASATRGFG